MKKLDEFIVVFPVAPFVKNIDYDAEFWQHSNNDCFYVHYMYIDDLKKYMPKKYIHIADLYQHKLIWKSREEAIINLSIDKPNVKIFIPRHNWHKKLKLFEDSSLYISCQMSFKQCKDLLVRA